MRPYFPFLSAVSNTNLKPGGLLKWKKRVVEALRLLLSLIEAIKIDRLTSPLPDMPHLSSPKPRLKHGRRHDEISLSNLCILSFVLSLAFLHLPLFLTFPTALLPGSRPRSADYLRSHFPAFQPKVLRSRARGYMSELRVLRSLIPLSDQSCPPVHFSQLRQTFPRPPPLVQTKSPIPC